MEQARKASLLIPHSEENRTTPDPLKEGYDLPTTDDREGQPRGITPLAKAPSKESPMETNGLLRQVSTETNFQKLIKQENPGTGLGCIKERGARS